MTEDLVYQKDFPQSDSSIHELAVAKLMDGSKDRVLLTQGAYRYFAFGGTEGTLCYKKGRKRDWVMIANWSFYGAYIVVRYRHAKWLRPMYTRLFQRMNFSEVVFHPHTIEAIDADGYKVSGRRLRLLRPLGMEEALVTKFGYSDEDLARMKALMPSLFEE